MRVEYDTFFVQMRAGNGDPITILALCTHKTDLWYLIFAVVIWSVFVLQEDNFKKRKIFSTITTFMQQCTDHVILTIRVMGTLESENNTQSGIVMVNRLLNKLPIFLTILQGDLQHS